MSAINSSQKTLSAIGGAQYSLSAIGGTQRNLSAIRDGQTSFVRHAWHSTISHNFKALLFPFMFIRVHSWFNSQAPIFL
jgi:anthranilate/para-aminobenzoate synthase component II